jgi:1-acyl-sn-glycerol-3-phosphate acyltransferase
MRFWLRFAALLGLILLCVPLHLATRLIRGRSGWPPRFLAMAGHLCGARVECRGTLPPGNVFIVANHVSWLDILALGGATGCAFVSRDDVGRWPVIGWLAAQNNTILIRRHERGSVQEQVETMRRAMAGEQPVALFPEGTTGDGRSVQPFKPALFSVLVPPPAPMMVQPVWIDYGPALDAMAWTGDEPAGANVRRILARRGTIAVTLHLLAPFDPAAFADRKAMAAEAWARIDGAMRALRGDARAV